MTAQVMECIIRHNLLAGIYTVTAKRLVISIYLGYFLLNDGASYGVYYTT